MAPKRKKEQMDKEERKDDDFAVEDAEMEDVEMGDDGAGAGKEGEPEKKKQKARERNKKTDSRARAQRPRRDLTDASANRNLTVHDATKRDHKSASEIFSERETEDLDRIKKALNNVQIKTARKATAVATAAEAQLLSSLFTGPPVQGRAWKAKLDSHTSLRGSPKTVSWIFGAEDNVGNYRFISGQHQTKALDQTIATKVATDLANMLNRWPGGLDTVSSPEVPIKVMGAIKAATWACRASVRMHLPNEPEILPSPTYNKHKSPPAISVQMQSIDPTTGEHYKHSKDIRCSVVAGATDIPQFPNVRYLKLSMGRPSDFKEEDLVAVTQDNNGNDVHASILPSNLGADEPHRANLLKAEAIGRALSAKFYGKMLDKKHAKKTADFYLEQWGKDQLYGSKAGPYDGKALVQMSWQVHSRTTLIQLSAAARKDVEGKIPQIRIHSLDRSRALPVMNDMTNTWIETADLKKTLLKGYEAARRENDKIANGVPSFVLHDCSDTNMCRSVVRHCGRCGKAAQCASLSSSVFNLDICKPCQSWEKNLKAGLPEEVAVRKADRRFWEECKKRKLKPEDVDVIKMHQELLAEVKQHFPDIASSWHDDFRSAEEYEIRPQAGGGTYIGDPFAPSVDAAFPYYPATSEIDFKHCAKNIAITSTALNLCKHQQLPALFPVLKYAMNIAEKPDLTAEDRDAADSAILKACNRLKKLRIKANFQAVLRAKQLGRKKFSALRYQLDLEEWRYGKMRRGSGPWDQDRCLSTPVQVGRGFRAEVQARMEDLIKMLEDEFGVTLVRGEGGCPWIGSQETMPESWSWGICNSLVSERWSRMDDYCNGLDETLDTPDMIFTEMIFVACVIKCTDMSDGKYYTAEQKRRWKTEYSEFLHLPMTAEIFSALCFAVAHKYHGMRLFSGWRYQPKTPADRIDENNNMLIETQSSNWLKCNFHGTTYDELKQMIRDVQLLPKFHDEHGKLRKEPPDEAYDFSQVDEKDGFDLEASTTDDSVVGFEVDEDDESFQEVIDDVESKEPAVDPAEAAQLREQLEDVERVIEDDYNHLLEDDLVKTYLENLDLAVTRGDGDGFREVQAALMGHLDA